MRHFFASLSGLEEVPPVQTNARGDAVFTINEDEKMMEYRLIIHNLLNFTEAHIHLGRRGENGPVVAFLFGPVDPGISVIQGIVRGNLSRKDLVGPLKGHPFSALLREMRSGNTYVNCHTVQNPEGEIRGQISPGKIGDRW
jgi:hypothetical protein